MSTSHPTSIDIEELLRDVKMVLDSPADHGTLTVRFAQALALMQTFKLQLITAMTEAERYRQHAELAGAAYIEILDLYDKVRHENAVR
jgi:hypothetical protein